MSTRKRKSIYLDVGGTKYRASSDTLERCKSTMLSSLVSGDEGKTAEDAVFIDRNGRLFEYVLDYVRTNKVYLPTTVSRAAVKDEFEYYGIAVNLFNVHEKYGLEYTRALVETIDKKQKELDALNAEKLAIQASALAESDFLKSKSTPSTTITVNVPDYALIRNHETLLREFFLARGLEYVSGNYRTSSFQVIPVKQ